jgi:hypothetical protein
MITDPEESGVAGSRYVRLVRIRLVSFVISFAQLTSVTKVGSPSQVTELNQPF